jgi:hypothetical protein
MEELEDVVDYDFATVTVHVHFVYIRYYIVA